MTVEQAGTAGPKDDQKEGRKSLGLDCFSALGKGGVIAARVTADPFQTTAAYRVRQSCRLSWLMSRRGLDRYIEPFIWPGESLLGAAGTRLGRSDQVLDFWMTQSERCCP